MTTKFEELIDRIIGAEDEDTLGQLLGGVNIVEPYTLRMYVKHLVVCKHILLLVKDIDNRLSRMGRGV